MNKVIMHLLKRQEKKNFVDADRRIQDYPRLHRRYLWRLQNECPASTDAIFTILLREKYLDVHKKSEASKRVPIRAVGFGIQSYFLSVVYPFSGLADWLPLEGFKRNPVQASIVVFYFKKNCISRPLLIVAPRDVAHSIGHFPDNSFMWKTQIRFFEP